MLPAFSNTQVLTSQHSSVCILDGVSTYSGDHVRARVHTLTVPRFPPQPPQSYRVMKTSAWLIGGAGNEPVLLTIPVSISLALHFFAHGLLHPRVRMSAGICVSGYGS